MNVSEQWTVGGTTFDGDLPFPKGNPREFGSAREQVPALSCGSDGAAKALGLSERTVEQLAREGVIPSFRVGGRRLFSIRALQEWVDQQQAEADGEDE